LRYNIGARNRSFLDYFEQRHISLIVRRSDNGLAVLIVGAVDHPKAAAAQQFDSVLHVLQCTNPMMYGKVAWVIFQ
jgi:hypothetical protein